VEEYPSPGLFLNISFVLNAFELSSLPSLLTSSLLTSPPKLQSFFPVRGIRGSIFSFREFLPYPKQLSQSALFHTQLARDFLLHLLVIILANYSFGLLPLDRPSSSLPSHSSKLEPLHPPFRLYLFPIDMFDFPAIPPPLRLHCFAAPRCPREVRGCTPPLLVPLFFALILLSPLCIFFFVPEQAYFGSDRRAMFPLHFSPPNQRPFLGQGCPLSSPPRVPFSVFFRPA